MLLDLVLATLENLTAKYIPSKKSLGLLKHVQSMYHWLLVLDNVM